MNNNQLPAIEPIEQKMRFKKHKSNQPNAAISISEELIIQYAEKEKRAEELLAANAELAFQNTEKAMRADELIIANEELLFQNQEKEKRAAELNLANIELAFQNTQKALRAEELAIANEELLFQYKEKEKKSGELLLANAELAFQNNEKAMLADELAIAYKELLIQNEEKEKLTRQLVAINNGLEEQNARQLKEVSDYKHALDASSIVAITDVAGIIIYANNIFCDISGYAVNELIGADHRIVNSGYHSKLYMQKLWMTIGSGKIWRGEIKNKAKDGSFYWVDKTIIPFLDENGKPYQYAAVGSDISLRKKAEQEINILNEELEARVKERTADLESFSYSVSHDLRAPLRAVNGYSRMLKSKYLGQIEPEADRLINNIENNATKMGDLIDDLLMFSRIGRREMTPGNLRMMEMVMLLCDELKNEESGREIVFNIGPLLDIKADYTGIKQVWSNLISNAIKYSRLKQKAVIDIGSERRGEEIVYYIKDNGAGFDMRYVGKLFGMFQRLHSEEEFEGTGVGLAIVQRIIFKHGGRVWAEGELDHGATFYFSLNIT